MSIVTMIASMFRIVFRAIQLCIPLFIDKLADEEQLISTSEESEYEKYESYLEEGFQKPKSCHIEKKKTHPSNNFSVPIKEENRGVKFRLSSPHYDIVTTVDELPEEREFLSKCEVTIIHGEKEHKIQQEAYKILL